MLRVAEFFADSDTGRARRANEDAFFARALGPEPRVEVDHMTTYARDGDVFLICSDGLTSMVGDDAIEEVLREAPELDGAGHALIDAANEAGGPAHHHP